MSTQLTACADSPRLYFKLPLDPARLMRARHRVRDYLFAQLVDAGVIDDVVLAIQEAMSNVVAHSTACDDLEVELCFEGDDLIARVRDHGVGMDVSCVDLSHCPGVEEAGHRGLYLIAHLMDETALVGDDGLEVRAVKRAARKSSPNSATDSASAAHSQARQLALTEEIDEGFFSLNWEYRYLSVNQVFERTFERPRADLIGRTIWEAFPLVRDDEAGQAVRDAMELGRPSIIEYVSPTAGRWLELRAYPSASGVTGYLREIDERKRREFERDELLRALRQSRDDLARAQEVGGVGSWRLDAHTNVLTWSAENYRIFGVAPGTPLTYETFLSIVHPDDRDAVDASWQAGLRGEPYDVEHRLLVDGQVKWVREKAFLEHDDAGRLLGGFGITQDITSRKRAELSLAEQEARTRSLFEHAPVAILEMDLRGPTLTSVNEYACLYSGYSREALIGMNPLDFLAADDQQRFREMLKTTLASGDEPPPMLDCAFISHDGTTHVAAITIALRFEDTTPVGALVVAQDLTERLRADESLSKSEAKYRELVEHANSAIIRWTRDGEIVFFNEYAEHLFGWPAEEAIGRHVSILLPAQDSAGVDLSPLVEDIIENPERFVTNTNENVRRDGTRLWVAWTNRAIYDEEGRVTEILTVGTDVTEQRLTFEALRRSEEKARAAFEHAAIGLGVTALDGRILEANSALCELTGYSHDEILATPLTELFHPDDAAENSALLARLVSGELSHFVLESRYMRKDHSTVWGRKSVSLTRDEDGAPRWFVALIEDIDQRKRAEAALLESQERLRQNELRLRLALDAAFLISFEWDIRRNEVWRLSSSDPALAATPADAPTTIEAVREIVHPDDRDTFSANVQAALGREDGTYESEFRIAHPDGGVAWLYERGRVERDDAGEPLRLVGLSQDITSRKNAEQALRDSEERFRLALRNAPVSVAAQDRDLRYIWAYNQRTAKPEQIIGKLDTDIFTAPEAERLGAIKRRVLDEGVEIRDEMWFERPDRRMYLEMHFEPMYDDAGAIVGCVNSTVDLTSMKLAEDSLREALADRSRLAEERAKQARRMTLLAEMAQTAASVLDVRELAQRLTTAVRTLLDPSHVSLALTDDNGQLHMVATQGYPAELLEGVPTALPDNSLLARAFVSARPMMIRSRDAVDSRDVSDYSRAWATAAGIGSFVALPLVNAGRPIGVLGMGWRAPTTFREDDLSLFDLLATEIAAGLENARRYEREHDVATRLREHFTRPLPQVRGVELALLSLPAAKPELVGGDFHDAFELPDGRIAAVIGDVMGKGIGAAGLAETIRGAVRALSFYSPWPAKVLRYVNRLMLALEHEEFASALVVIVDPKTGQGRVASAGHPAPIVRTAGGDVSLVEPRYGTVLGAFSSSYSASNIALPAGGALVLYTDGIIEARRAGEMFGEQRLLQAIREAPAGSPQAIVDHVRGAVTAFAGELQDDAEILVLQLQPATT